MPQVTSLSRIFFLQARKILPTAVYGSARCKAVAPIPCENNDPRESDSIESILSCGNP